MRRATFVASFVTIAILVGCGRPHVDARRAVRTEVHTAAGIAVTIFETGDLTVRRLRSGRRVVTIPAPRRSGSSFGAFLDAPVCPTRATADGHLVVRYPMAIRVFRVATGAQTFEFPYGSGGPQRACPGVAADSAVLLHLAGYHGSGTVFKVRPNGEAVWRRDLPDIGPVLGSIEVDATSGDAIATSATHILSIDPTGRIGWVVEHGRGFP